MKRVPILALALIFLLARPTFGASLVQNAGNFANTATSVVVTLASAPKAGNVLFAGCAEQVGGPPTDSGAATWAAVDAGIGQDFAIGTGLTGTTAVTCTYTQSDNGELIVAEFSGVTSVADATAGHLTWTASTAVVSNTITTTNANDLLIVYCGTGTGITFSAVTAGYTLILREDNGVDSENLMYYKIVNTVQTAVSFTATASASTNGVCSLQAFILNISQRTTTGVGASVPCAVRFREPQPCNE